MNIIRVIDGEPVGKPQTIPGNITPKGYLPLEVQPLKPLQRHVTMVVGNKVVMQAVDMNLGLAKYYKKQEIAEARWDECKNGFLFETTTGEKYWAASDESARLSVKVKADEAANADETWSVCWKFDNFIVLNKANMLKLYTDGLAFVEERFQAEAILLAGIESAETVEQLRVINWIEIE